ncbi:MAG: hypothetical protein ORN21_04510, partial [Methylophilaceae bacterium]|nr:hypothetical protein [Methylophilaceae bacterium]
MTLTTAENQIEDPLIKKLEQLKYVYRSDIRDRAALEANFRQKFESLNQVRLTDGELIRLLEEITTPDVFSASRTNRVLNGTKPYGNILDFRQQQDAVDAAIALFSGETTTPPLWGTPPQEGNKRQAGDGANSPPVEGWQAKPVSQFPSVGGVSRSDGVVPKLRFPEFRGTVEWGVKRLGDVCEIATGLSNRVNSAEAGGAYTFFDRSQDIRTSDIFLFDGEGQEFIPKYFVGKFDLHQRTYAITNFSKISGKYLYYYLYQFRNYFLSQAVGS